MAIVPMLTRARPREASYFWRSRKKCHWTVDKYHLEIRQDFSWESEVTLGLNGARATKTDIIATDCADNTGDSGDN